MCVSCFHALFFDCSLSSPARHSSGLPFRSLHFLRRTYSAPSPSPLPHVVVRDAYIVATTTASTATTTTTITATTSSTTQRSRHEQHIHTHTQTPAFLYLLYLHSTKTLNLFGANRMGPILENVLCNGTLLLLDSAAYPALCITIDLCALLDCRHGRELPLISSVPSLWYALGTCSERCLRSTSVKEARDPHFILSEHLLLDCLFVLFISSLYFWPFFGKSACGPLCRKCGCIVSRDNQYGQIPLWHNADVNACCIYCYFLTLSKYGLRLSLIGIDGCYGHSDLLRASPRCRTLEP